MGSTYQITLHVDRVLTSMDQPSSDLLFIGTVHIVKLLHEKELVGSLAGCPVSESLSMTLLDLPRCQQTFPGGNDVLW